MNRRTNLRCHSRVGFHYDFRRVVLAVHRQLNIVGSCIDSGAEVEEAAEAATTAATATAATAAAAKSRWQVGRAWRRITAQVPLHAIDADVLCSHEGADHFARIIRDGDLHIA